MARTEPPPSVTSRAPWFSVRWLVPLTTAAVVVTAVVLMRDPGIVPPTEVQKTASAPAAPSSSAAIPPSADTKQDAVEARRDGEQRQDVPEKKDAGKPPAALADSAASKV